MPRGEDTRYHPGRQVHRERYTGFGRTVPGSIAEGMEIRSAANRGYGPSARTVPNEEEFVPHPLASQDEIDREGYEPDYESIIQSRQEKRAERWNYKDTW